ncbi:hypothetical protein PIB30_058097 [Stylosanthes scabra]|uniref:LOB domain-containing protein n=1 Tax=Stylosanthes scabra TaxID=79078 RepID=A0ABU6WLY2_9FABA|nr:hypothetical protein [Stylosanthes scabra]
MARQRQRGGINLAQLAGYYAGDVTVVEETKREDAVKAMVYEAKARLRDPVYGSTGAIFHLQKMIEELKEQLESIRTRVSELRRQKEHYLFMMLQHNHNYTTPYDHENNSNDPIFQGYYTTFSSDLDDSSLFEFPVQEEGHYIIG